MRRPSKGIVFVVLFTLALIIANTWVLVCLAAPVAGFLTRVMTAQNAQLTCAGIILALLVAPPLLLAWKLKLARKNKAWGFILLVIFNALISFGLIVWWAKFRPAVSLAPGKVSLPALLPGGGFPTGRASKPKEVASANGVRIMLQQADGTSADAVCGGNRVAFRSSATNLAEGDTNGKIDVFVLDLSSNSWTRYEARNGNDVYDAAAPTLSSNGRQLAFTGEGAGSRFLFVVDLENGKTEVLSENLEGFEYAYPRFVDTNEGLGCWIRNAPPGKDWDFYVRRLGGRQSEWVRVTGTDSAPLASKTPYPGTGHSDVYNGTTGWIALEMPDPQAPTQTGVFLTRADRDGHYRASVSSSGALANASCSRADKDGNWVVFESEATNLVEKDGNGVKDVFMHDKEKSQTFRLSQRGNLEANGPSSNIVVTGRGVAFESEATNLVGMPSGTKAQANVYCVEGSQDNPSPVLVSHNATSANTPGNGPSSRPYLSRSILVFQSLASDLISSDDNGFADVFMLDGANSRLLSGRYYEELDSSVPADSPLRAYVSYVQAARAGNTAVAASYWSRAQNRNFPQCTGNYKLTGPASFSVKAVQVDGNLATLSVSESSFMEYEGWRSSRNSRARDRRYNLVKEDDAWKLDQVTGDN